MSEDHPSPFPTALLLDTSFLRTIGGTDSDTYQTFIQYVEAEDVQLYVNYPALLALTRSLRAGLARHLGGWDSPTRSRLVAQGQTPAAI